MRTSFSQIQKTQLTRAGLFLLENDQMNTSLEFADPFCLAEHERKQAKKRLGRSRR